MLSTDAIRSRFPAVAASLAVPLLILAAPAALASEDASDQPYITVLVNRALETERTNVEIPWSNPETGHRGAIVIERTFYRDPNTPCREYRRTLERPGQDALTVRGTGCRIGAGLWKLDEEGAPPAVSKPTTEAGKKPSVPHEAPAKKPASRRKPPVDAGKATGAPSTSPPGAATAPPEGVARTPTSKSPALPSYTPPSKAEL